MAALAVLICLLAVGCGPLPDLETMQDRTTVPAEQPVQGHTIGQTFTASQSGLSAIDLTFAVYPQGQGDEAGELIVSLWENTEGEKAIARARLPIAGLRHNERYRLSFPPQPESRGRQYLLTISATTAGPARATVWAAEDDAYSEGSRFRDGVPTSGDLAFHAYYDYSLPQLATDIVAALARRGWLLLPALALLLLPGLAIERWLLPGLALDAAEAVGVWLGLSLAGAPVFLLAATALGVRLDGRVVVALLVLAGLLGLAAVRRGRTPQRPKWRRAFSPAGGAFVAAAAALVLRFVHAKDLALPMWVDSVHHTLIAKLIAASGQVPVDYGPLVPSQPFTYHFGFHTQVAWLHWLTGMEIERAVLFVGQLLGGLAVFPTYLLASRLTGDRRAGLVAGSIVGLISTMPAYYVSWGRYPQLAGLLVLPVAWLLLARSLRPGRTAALLAVAAFVAAGEVLVHPRVALLLAALALAEAAVFLARWPLSLRYLARAAMAYGEVAAAAGVLLAPWLARLALSPVVATMAMPLRPTIGNFPLGLLSNGNDRFLLGGALAAALVGVVGRRREALVAVLWVVFSLVAANPYLIGLPVNLVLSNEALAIALFLPIAVLDGALVAMALPWLRHDAWPQVLRLAMVVALATVAALSGMNLAGIVNPTCDLATAADVDALHWVRSHTDPQATFLINARHWQYGIYAGSDGGYWLPVLGERKASLPPAIYAHGSVEDQARIASLAALVESAPVDAAALRPGLLAEGITHIFVGARGGPLRRDVFAGAEGYRTVYDNGKAMVVEVLPP